MGLRLARDGCAGGVDAGMGNDFQWRGAFQALDARGEQGGRRQVQAADGCVFVDIAQDVGELQRAPR